MSFLRGALVLTAAGLFTKIIGALYRVPLTYLLGAEGIGLYQMAYPIYGMAYILSASGVPVAVAKMIAEELAHGRHYLARRIFHVALGLLFLTGLVIAIALYQLAPFISRHILGDPRAYYPLRSIAPAVFFVAILTALRGYFQGNQAMTPIACSQVLEQLVRVSTMLGLAYFLLPLGLEYAAAGATFGAVTGALMGIGFLGTTYIRAPKPSSPKFQDRKSVRIIIGTILRLALPVTFGAFIMPVMETVDAAIVPLRLQAVGFTINEATALYGQLAGMALTLIVFPTVITSAFAFSLVPAISQAVSLGQEDVVAQRVREALRVTVLVGMPATVGLYLLPREICQLLFRTPEAGIPLTFLAYGCFFLCLQQTTAGILQGLGRPTIPVQSILIGALCNAVLNYHLTAIPALNIRGAALGTGFGFTVAALFNLRAVLRFGGTRLSLWSFFARPLPAVLAMAAAIQVFLPWAVNVFGGSSLAVLVTILAAGLVYGLMAILTGALPWRYLVLFGSFPGKKGS